MSEFVATIGAFDGVHQGHRALVAATLADARRRGMRAVGFTFSEDPAHVLAPESAPPDLLGCADRARLLRSLGLDEVVVIPFDAQMAACPYPRFVDEQLGACGTLRALHVGADFRAGARGAGTPQALAELGAERGFDVTVEPYATCAGERVSATRIRALVADGSVARAAELLGRPHYVRGRVEHGRGQGTAFGFPTANVSVDGRLCLPAEGVYEGFVHVGDTAYPAAINVGEPRSLEFAGERGAAFLEAFLLGFAGDLYGAEVAVSFTRWLRAPRVFTSLAELESTVLANIEQVRVRLGAEGRALAPGDALDSADL